MWNAQEYQYIEFIWVFHSENCNFYTFLWVEWISIFPQASPILESEKVSTLRELACWTKTSNHLSSGASTQNGPGWNTQVLFTSTTFTNATTTTWQTPMAHSMEPLPRKSSFLIFVTHTRGETNLGMWIDFWVPHICHACVWCLQSPHSAVYAVLLQFTLFCYNFRCHDLCCLVAKSVLSQLMRFCVKKFFLTKYSFCKEEITNIRYTRAKSNHHSAGLGKKVLVWE